MQFFFIIELKLMLFAACLLCIKLHQQGIEQTFCVSN